MGLVLASPSQKWNGGSGYDDTEAEFRLSRLGRVTEVGIRPMRADGLRNRARVLDAAVALFAEQGVRVPIEEIAQRAGVGVGTVCRHFPTKEALVDAALTGMWEQLLEQAQTALADPDAGQAFAAFVTALGDFQSDHRALAEEMATTVDLPPSTEQLKRALRQVVLELVERAQRAGAVRTDIGPSDIAMLFAGIAHVAGLPGVDSTLRARYLTIVLDGLRPIEPSALPGAPLSFEGLDRARRRSIPDRASS
jgi:AcrR family transcriptional regulator